MKMKQPRVNINIDPFSSPVEVVGDIVLGLGPGCTNTQAVVIVNPNIHGYKDVADMPGVKMRQMMEVLMDENTQSVTLHFNNAYNSAEIVVDGIPYRITLCGGGPGQHRLDDTGALSQTGQWFNHYTFDVEWEIPDGLN